MTDTLVPALHGAELRLLSLFSGAGGMDVGLELAGFEPIACLEINKVAQETLRLNRPNWPVWENGDVVSAAKSLTPREFGLEPGELDLIAGGPPCQPFSTAGQWATNGRLGMEDTRANTVHALLDLFERFRPRAVLLENVQGFLSGPSSALPEIERRVAHVNNRYGTSYTLHWLIVNAADYGVPQNRKRAITVIAESSMSWSWPEPSHVAKPVTAWDALCDLHESAESLPRPQGKWATLLASIPEGNNYQWLTSEGGGEELFGYRTRYWNFLLKLAKDRPSWTLPASPGPSAGPFHWDNRPLSVRERMRLQSFPDYWELAGGFRDQVKLVGNATPPLLAEIVGSRIAESLGGTAGKLNTLLSIQPALTEPGVAEHADLPGEFRHLVGRKAAHGGTGKGPAPKSSAKSESQVSDKQKENV